jgi:hypothetical protein
LLACLDEVENHLLCGLDALPQQLVDYLEHSLNHNITHHITTQHNTTQHNTTQHNTTQHNTTHHITTQHNTTQHNTTQHNTTQHNTSHHITSHHNTTHVSHSQICIHPPTHPPVPEHREAPQLVRIHLQTLHNTPSKAAQGETILWVQDKKYNIFIHHADHLVVDQVHALQARLLQSRDLLPHQQIER